MYDLLVGRGVLTVGRVGRVLQAMAGWWVSMKESRRSWRRPPGVWSGQGLGSEWVRFKIQH